MKQNLIYLLLAASLMAAPFAGASGTQNGHTATKKAVPASKPAAACRQCTGCLGSDDMKSMNEAACAQSCPACKTCDTAKCFAAGQSPHWDLGMSILAPTGVVTVPSGVDWSIFRGFGQAAGMVAMMNEMMVTGNPMEGMKMAPMTLEFTAAVFGAEWELAQTGLADSLASCPCCGMKPGPAASAKPSQPMKMGSGGMKGMDPGSMDHSSMNHGSMGHGK